MPCITQKEAKTKHQRVNEIIDLLPKIESAKTLIQGALSKSTKPAIAFSGGKDSLIVLDLVRSISKDVIAVFENTTNEYPETLKFVKSIPNIIELLPEKTFRQCVDEYGLPESKAKGKRHGSACCYWLKEKPAKDYYKTEKVDLVFTGLTMAESRNRMMMLKRMGAYYFYKKDKYFKCHPVFDWTEKEVWAYIDFKKLNYNEVYDRIGRVIDGRYTRCGCSECTAFDSWMSVANKYNENITNRIMREKGFKLLIDFE